MRKELTELRTTHSKTFQDGERFTLSSSISRIHHLKNGKLEEFDLNIKDMRVSSAPYDVEILPSIGAVYQSPSGTVTIQLRGNYQAVPVVSGNTVRWEIAQDTIIEFVAKTNGIEFFKYINSPAGLHHFEWDVTESTPGLFVAETMGRDANKKHLEITYGKSNESGSFIYSETVTGRKSEINHPNTRKKRWVDGAVYPFKVDVAVNEVIATNNDDGQEATFYTNWSARTGAQVTWYFGNFGTAAHDYNGGTRFQTIAIPQGATINSATITVNVVTNPGAATAKIYGDDVDDAAAWSNTDRPSQVTKTTANVTFDPAGTGDKVIDVKTIVQELVDRAGWASGNDMRFAFLESSANGNYAGMYDFNVGNTALSARLDIDYTAAAGGVVQVHSNLALLGVG